MSCDCFKIGGPFIAEDPKCPVHGVAAQQEQAFEQERSFELNQELEELIEKVNSIDTNPKEFGQAVDSIGELTQSLGQLCALLKKYNLTP